MAAPSAEQLAKQREAIDILVGIAHRIENGDAGAIRQFLQATGKLVGPSDVHGAAAGSGVRTFVETCLLPSGTLGMDDAQCALLIDAIRSPELTEARRDKALEMLTRELEQPYLSALLFYPRDGAERSSTEIVKLARAIKGKALAPYLDPMCNPEDPDPTKQPPTESDLALARALLSEMAVMEEIELTSGELAATELARALPSLTSVEQLVDHLIDNPGIGECFAEDDELADRIAQIRGGRRA